MASGDRGRHRLSRAGDRKLNSALHIAAVTQARTPNSDGYAYYQRKLAENKTRREAMRCLKRRIADRVWRTMRADERHRIQGAGPGRTRGGVSFVLRGWLKPRLPALRTSHFPGPLTASLRRGAGRNRTMRGCPPFSLRDAARAVALLSVEAPCGTGCGAPA